jgi:chromatin remodeling complex protein RSC6
MSNTKSSNKSNTMPVAKKTAPKTAAKADVTVPVAAPAPTPAPVAAAAPAPVAATTPSTAPVETRSADVILTSVQDALKSLNVEVTGRIRALVAEAAEAAKAVKRSVRESKRRVRKDPETMTPEERATWEARRANNAFLKPRLLSDEMATFMGLPAKSLKSQTDVTKFVSQYVKANGCFDPAHKRRIVPDAKLAKLLRVSDDQEVTYLNLQKFLKAHFIKTDAPKAA